MDDKSPALAAFIKTAVDLPLSQLPSHLSSFPSRWPFPRGDLYHWIPVLNRFDHILELFNEEYGLNTGPQTQPFKRGVLCRGDTDDGKPSPPSGTDDAGLDLLGFGEEGDRELIEALLSFSRILLENCGNRSLYASSGRLNDLLNTTSLSLLSCTLRLGVRLAQRYYASRQRTASSLQHVSAALLASHYNINLDKVHSLALPFSKSTLQGSHAQWSTSTPTGTPSGKGKERVSQTVSAAPGSSPSILGTDLVAFVKDDSHKRKGTESESNSAEDQDWAEWGCLRYLFYAEHHASDSQKSGTQDSGPGSEPSGPESPTPVRRVSSLGPHHTPRPNRTSTSDDVSTPVHSPSQKPEDRQDGGLKAMEVPVSMVSSCPILKVLRASLPELPQNSHYEFMSKLRTAYGLSTSLESRRELVAIRMLAITNLAYIHPETSFQQKILQQDSDEPRRLQLAYQLAELVHPSGTGSPSIPRHIQTLALGTLEGLAKHKSKAADVCAALSVNVNHGVLLYVIRKAIAELGAEDGVGDSMIDDEWREALFSLLGTLPTSTPRTGEALIAAGLLQILSEALTLRTAKAERNHPKVLNFLDTFVYGIRDAFQTLANARGLDIISDLTAYEVDSAFERAKSGEGMPSEYRNQVTDYQIPFFQQQTLRWLFKFINHMMSHSGGNFDRLLRNLIDSPQLLGGLRTVLGNSNVFGSSVWSGAVNILSNFIHNEPTSYAVIAEAGLSKGLLQAVTQKEIVLPEEPQSQPGGDSELPTAETRTLPEGEDTVTEDEGGQSQEHVTREGFAENTRIKRKVKVLQAREGPLAQGILPATDAIAAVPQAFGAICLNSAGMKLFQASDALESFFEIFESPEHVKCLESEIDLPSILGSSFDELVRHHPPLKSSVMSSVLVMIARVDFLCHTRAWSKGVGAKLWVESDDGQVTVAGGRKSLYGEGGPFHKNEQEAFDKAKENLDADQTIDVEMTDAGVTPKNALSGDETVSLEDLSEKEDATNGPSVSTYINVAVKFLSGFFANTSLCSSFIEMGGVEYVLDFTTLPSLPYDFNSQAASQELARVIHMLVEQKPHLVLPSLIKRTLKAADALGPFCDHNDASAFFAPLTTFDDSTHHGNEEQAQHLKANGTQYVKSLVAVHTLSNVLYETFSQPMFNHRSSHTVFSQVNLADMYVKLVNSLGRLHRACVWEEVLLQKNIPDPWKEATQIKGFGFGNEDADEMPSSRSRRDETQTGPVADTGALESRPSSAVDPATSSSTEKSEQDKKADLERDQKTAQYKNVQILRYLLSQIQSSITPFFQGLGKVLVAKRGLDPYPKQNAVMVADALAEAALEQLRFPALEKALAVQDRYAYWIAILSSISQLMIEGPIERPHPQSLTLVLQAFKNMGGLDTLKHILEVFFEEVKTLAPNEEQQDLDQDVSARLTSAYGGIKIILNFYSQITTAKNIVEASQTTAIASRERDKDKPDYFSPGQFLVELRAAVLPSVRSMWESDFVDKASSSIVKNLIEILRIVLEGDHEQGASRRADKVPPRGKASFKAWKANSEHLTKLTEKKYDPNLAREALYRSNNNLNMAQEYCVSQQGHFRVSRNPIPDYESQQLPARSRSSPHQPDSEAPAADSSDLSDNVQATMAPPVGPDGHSVLLEDAQVTVNESNGDGSAIRIMSTPPIPGSLDDESPEDQGLLAMSIDNILGSVGIPVHEELASGSGEATGRTSPSPNRVEGIEAGKLPEVVTLDDLDDERSAIRENLIDRALDVLNVHSDVTFELADLINSAVTKDGDSQSLRREIGETLVQSLISLQIDEDFRPAGKKIAAYAHLLALVLQEKEFYEATLDELKENFSTLLGFVRVFPDQSAEQSSSWIGNVLLIIERLLAEDAQPHQIKWTAPSIDNPRAVSPIAELSEPVVPAEEKAALFEALLEVLPRIGKDESLALSVVRTLVILTRNRELAIRLGQKKNMQRLFVMVKQLAGITNERLQSAFMLVLRHVIEDEETLKQIMRSEIVAMFQTRHQRQTDTTVYTRQMYHLVLRSPEIFVEITNEKLKLPRYDSTQRPQMLALKKEEKSDIETTEAPAEEIASTQEASDAQEMDGVRISTEAENKEANEKPKGPEIKPPVIEHPDGVIHYLLCELLSYKDVEDKEQNANIQQTSKEVGIPGQPNQSGTADVNMDDTEGSSSPTPTPANQETKKSEKPEFKADQHPIYVYRCFLLQCLTELLSCYNRTKIEFINFSRKADPQATTPSKPRSGVLNYLLNAIIPIGTLNHGEDIAFRKRYSTSNWAISVVVALCSKTGEREFDKSKDTSDTDDEPDLLFVRKFVLEHALKAYKDAHTSSEALDIKYARMMNLADLFNRMLTGKPNSGGNNVGSDLLLMSQKQLARTMFEKNFIAALTSSIADIDLNFPCAKRAVKYILRPLKLLTQTAIDLSLSSSLSTTPGQTDDDEISTASSVSDPDISREETPDLFRNSTLGMLEPGREEETSSESSEGKVPPHLSNLVIAIQLTFFLGDEDMYEDEFDDEMEYDEDIPGEDGDVVSDEDEEIEGMEHMEGLPGDVGMDVEVVIDDGDDDEEPTDDDDEDEMGEGEDDISIEDEVEGDDNGSLEGDEDEEWQSEEEDGEDYDGDELIGVHELDHGHVDSPIEHIVRALEGDEGYEGPSMLERLEGGDLDMDLDPEGYMEDDMGEDEEDEDDEDDMEEDDVIYEPDMEDDEAGMPNMPWGWDSDEPRLLARGHHHHHHRGPSPWSILPPGGPADRGMFVPAYRSHRPTGANRGNDDGSNPLLQRSGGQGTGGISGRGGRPEAMSDWVHAIDPHNAGRGFFSSDSPVSLINNLITAVGQAGGPGLGAFHHHGGALHFHIAGGPSGMLPRELQALMGTRRPPQDSSRQSRDDPAMAVSFVPTVTTNRWQDEARLLFGSSYVEKTQRVINSLLRVMVPPAMEEEKLRKERQAEELRKLREEREKKAEEDRLAREKAEQEAKEKREQEEREAAERAAAEAEAAAARSQEEGAADEAEASAEAAQQSADGQEMEGIETSQPADLTGDPAEAGPSEPQARVHTTIRGRELDITGMEIDPEYLEALPEELREEVLMHQLAEQRSQAAAAGEEPTDISREFLEALPAEIREELLQQEAQDRRRREREEARRRAASNSGSAARAEDMDPASFLASLEPTLRQAVLMEQDEEVLAQLPQSIAAEARALGGDRRLHQFMDIPHVGRAREIAQGNIAAEQASKKPQRRQIIQMLDKAGVATLLRLMFIPQQGSARHSLNGILQNVCENRQNRAEVVSMILHILQDGSADLTAVERSFAHLSLRAKPATSQKTPQPVKRTLTGQFTPGTAELSPLMVVQQCLSSLVFLTQYNPHIPSFFLTEHEGSLGLKSRSSRKGKGKESRASKFPLNALLSLLDRKLIMENSTVMEHLSSLLNSITHPLTMLLKRDREKDDDEPDGDNVATPSASAAAASAEQAVPDEPDQHIPDAPAVAEGESQTADPDANREGKADGDVEKTKKQRSLTPPIVPEANLRLVVNILAARECSAKTFRDTLSTINNLSAIPEAKGIFGKELIKQAQDLAQSILKDLDDLVDQIKQAKTGTDVQGMALAKFSPASSDQAKLLRVLTALDYLFDTKRNDNKVKSDDGKNKESEAIKDDLLTTLYENSTFGPLWNKLSECLSAIRSRDNMLNVATILLPLVEALMVVCKNTTLKDAPILKAQQRDFAAVSPPPESPMENLFFNFTEEHRKILNDLVRQNPKLMSGTFSLLVKNPKVLEFDNKRNYFTRRLHSRGAEARHPQPPLQLQVRRDQVFLDSFKSLYFKSGDEMKYGKLSIRFHGEEGVDAGGVTREWFQVLSRQMFNPDYALFTPVASDRTTFHPNRLSSVNQEHFMFFKFIGRIIGKALYEGRVLDCHFSRAVYKRILGKPVSIKDMETLDLDYYKSLVWMLGNDITDIITETFAVETEAFGESQIIDLIENGRNIPVTEENKHEYVRLVVEYRLTGSVQEQLEHFLRGFHDIVPADLISIFNEQELELLISGLPDIDVDDWKNNTEYHNYSASSPQIQWFWRAVRSFDKEERAKLLQFVTGTSKVPLNGFKELEGMNGFSRFNIHRDYGSKERLPSSHTCFNQLDLPEYENYDSLRKHVYIAMTAGGEYFGFA
ncbi:MAG: hypothetical protein M1819_002100 [Sarea resinae]|nr:MAG: hypothetical protein M1819_002100 [Sarea resinae]